jgi:hypothetical protein
MRFALLGACATLFSLAASGQSAPPPAGPPAAEAGAGLPSYMVVEGQYPREEQGQQALTVVCPGNHVVLGAGYTALVRRPAKAGQRRGALREGGLSSVRSMPDMGGRAWRVEAVSREAQAMKTNWRLVVRVVCMAPIR